MLYFIQHFNYSTVKPVLMKHGHDENFSLAEKFYKPKHLESRCPKFNVQVLEGACLQWNKFVPLLFSYGHVLMYVQYTLYLLAVQHHTVRLK
jgi:Cu2+-containing amine oxidase